MSVTPDFVTKRAFSTNGYSDLFSNVTNASAQACPEITFLPEEHAAYVFGLPSICFVSIVSNVINLIVLTRKTLQGSCYTYLIALAVADLFTSLFVLPIGLVRCSYCYTNDTAGFFRRLYEVYIMLPLNNMSGATGDWLILVMGIERFVFVKFPHSSKHFCTKRMALRAIALVVLGSIAINIPYFFRVIDRECTRVRRVILGKVFLSIISWCNAILVIFAPTLFLCITNLLLVTELCKLSRKWMNKKSPSAVRKRQKSQNRLTKTLICLFCVYLFGKTPIIFAVPGVYEYVFTDTLTYKRYRLAANLLFMLCVASNMFIYCTINKRFRRELKIVLGLAKQTATDQATDQSDEEQNNADKLTWHKTRVITDMEATYKVTSPDNTTQGAADTIEMRSLQPSCTSTPLRNVKCDKTYPRNSANEANDAYLHEALIQNSDNKEDQETDEEDFRKEETF